MIIVEVKSTDTKTKSGEAKDTGKPYTIVDQQIWLHGVYENGFASDVPRSSVLQLDEKKPNPAQPGFYALSDETFYFGSFNKLLMGKARLVPLGIYMAEANKQVSKIAPSKPLQAAA